MASTQQCQVLYDNNTLERASPGSALVEQHLVHLMLVQMLRLYLYEPHDRGVGWLYTLADRKLGIAIDLMHSDHRGVVRIEFGSAFGAA